MWIWTVGSLALAIRLQAPPSLNPLETLMNTGSAPPLSCDVTFENSLCLKNGRHVLLPPASSDGLVARYGFDSGSLIDSSGNGQHGVGTIYPGPSPFGGSGYSAVLRSAPLTVPSFRMNSEATREWAVSFWIFLLEDSQSAKKGETFCPLFARGEAKTTEAANANASPVIWVNSKSGQLRVGVSTTRDPTALEFMESHSRLSKQQWYRLTVVRQERRLVLFVNGVKDSFLDTAGEIIEVDDVPLFLGSRDGDCDLPFLIDDLEIWNISPGALYIEALSSAALPIEPARLELSCVKCTKTEAEEGCSASYHLCSEEEMAGGGVLHVADALGWTKLGFRIFTSGPQKGGMMQTHTPPSSGSTIAGTEGDDSAPGIGVCCRDH